MIRFRLAEQIEKKQFDEGRRIGVQTVSKETSISRVTLSKILNQKGYSTGTEVVDKLCNYFGCQVQDLMEHVPDGAAIEQGAGDHAAK